ncbi:MAG: hypothetical protein IJP04_07905 [Clostridia bacterium]|nr:hypothetical protein [Clostridia bacterium]
MGVNKVVYGGNTLIDLSADTVAANKMLAGITGHDKAGNPITGNIPSQAAQTITPGTADKTIAAGKYLSGTQTIKGDANLVAGNIKSGVSIFGVAGSYEGSGGGGGEMQVAEGSFTPSSYNIKTTPISITGLGFTPKLVIVKAAKTSQIEASNMTVTGGVGLLMITGGLYNSWVAIYKSSSTSFGRGYTDESGTASYTYDLSVSDDGFTISTASNSGALSSVMQGINYEYFAIG